MSGNIGDKSRFNRMRKQKIARRVKKAAVRAAYATPAPAATPKAEAAKA